MDQQSYWSFENEIRISYKDCNTKKHQKNYVTRSSVRRSMTRKIVTIATASNVMITMASIVTMTVSMT